MKQDFTIWRNQILQNPDVYKRQERAFQEVRWGKRPENIQVLEQAGITVDKFGGEAFRAAVSEGNTCLLYTSIWKYTCKYQIISLYGRKLLWQDPREARIRLVL